MVALGLFNIFQHLKGIAFMDIDSIRREYLATGLNRENLDEDPIVQFQAWLQQSIDAGMRDPTAMTLATVSQDGQPSQRIVLLKDVNREGFVFFTNYESQKAKDIAENPRVCLHFPWHDIERQVRITGRAERISVKESLAYFLTRPKESQLAAWASKQSARINSRQALLSQFNAIKAKFTAGEVPLPDFWGGYLIKPESFEFWQGRENRLHDRFEYRQVLSGWSIHRLAP
ncbi:MAG: pyridoxamine 5'-phosphate oxidase [Flavobacteriales bacterium]|jgi:pyridoxamine 5'-phosphate oxidase